MAKKLPQGEKPYEPVKAALAESVISRTFSPEPSVPPQSSPPPRLAVVPSLPSPPALPERAAETTQRVEQVRPASGAPVGAFAHEREAPIAQEVSRPRDLRREQALDVERLTREKRFLLSRVEETELEALVQRVALELRTPVKFSHILRAAMLVIRHAEEDLLAVARQHGPVVRPPNSEATKLAEFELRLATIVSNAIRRGPPLRA